MVSQRQQFAYLARVAEQAERYEGEQTLRTGDYIETSPSLLQTC